MDQRVPPPVYPLRIDRVGVRVGQYADLMRKPDFQVSFKRALEACLPGVHQLRKKALSTDGRKVDRWWFGEDEPAGWEALKVLRLIPGDALYHPSYDPYCVSFDVKAARAGDDQVYDFVFHWSMRNLPGAEKDLRGETCGRCGARARNRDIVSSSSDAFDGVRVELGNG